MNAITDQLDKIVKALRAKDLDALAELYTADVVSFDIDPPLQHRGLAAKLKNWENVFAFFQTVNYELQDIHVTTSTDLAYAHGFGRLTGTLPNGTQPPGMWVRATFCFRNIDNTWLIAHDHISVPYDITTGKGVANLEP